MAPFHSRILKYIDIWKKRVRASVKPTKIFAAVIPFSFPHLNGAEWTSSLISSCCTAILQFWNSLTDNVVVVALHAFTTYEIPLNTQTTSLYLSEKKP